MPNTKSKSPIFNTTLMVVVTLMLVSSAYISPNDVPELASSEEVNTSLLQYTADGHVLGFDTDKVYLAGLDHALTVEFINGQSISPIGSASPSTQNSQEGNFLGQVSYKNVWIGIDILYQAVQGEIAESIYIVHPGVDPEKIQLKHNTSAELLDDGSLKFLFETGYMTESAPIAFQEINGQHIPVEVSFVLEQDIVRFELGEYNPDHILTIDPIYTWHTFYPSDEEYDSGLDITTDESGNIYVVANSNASWNGPGEITPLNSYSGSIYSDIVVIKLDSTGTYQWHTFYGSEADDFGRSIISYGNNIYVIGISWTTWDGPASKSPLNSHSEDGDIVIIKLDNSGLYQWHTFYGSNSWDSSYGITVNQSGIFAAGYSNAAWNGPSDVAPLNPYAGLDEMVVVKLDFAGAYQWHTFYGSTDHYDCANDITSDANGVYIVGKSTGTWNGPGEIEPLNAYTGYEDIVVLNLDNIGTYQWHTFYGASGSADKGFDIIGIGNNLYITGFSSESWSGPSNILPVDTYSGGEDIVIVKLDKLGNYQWHTFYGSSSDDIGYGVGVDASGNIYVAGDSAATWDGPGSIAPGNAFAGGANDIVMVAVTGDGEYQKHSFYGSLDNDKNGHLTVDSNGFVYITGWSYADWSGPNGITPLNPYTGNSLVVLKFFGSTSIIYVKADANGLNDGTSWDNAYTDLQTALSVAAQGDEIWVAAGTYKPTSGTDRTISFPLKDGVALYGGFNGTENLRDQRDWEINVVILSGDLSDNDNDNIHPDEPTRADNSYHVIVITGSGTAGTAILDGFLISDGNANGTSGYIDLAGGIFNYTGSPSFNNIIVTKNSASDSGGGMVNYQSSHPLIYNSSFIDNYSGNSGGGIHNYKSDPYFDNVSITNNISVFDGGGINNSESNPTIVFSNISSNLANRRGGGLNNSSSNPMLVNTKINGNSASTEGGGLYNHDSTPIYDNVQISGNYAGTNGGGVWTSLGGLFYNIRNSTITGNFAAGLGGGFYFANGSLDIYNSIIWKNKDSNGESLASQIGDGSYSEFYTIIQNNSNTYNGNLNEDPLFISPIDPNDAPTDSGNFELSSSSPAIDAGNNDEVPIDILDLDNDTNTSEKLPLDIKNQDRFVDISSIPDTGNGTSPIVDMGAYEYPYNENDGIILYELDNYSGSRKDISQPGFYNLFDFNDLTSSIDVNQGWSAKVFENIDRGGSSRCIQFSISDLSTYRFDYGDIGLIMNDNISSVELYDNPNCNAEARLYELANFGGSIMWIGEKGFSNEPNANTYSLELPLGWSAMTWRDDNRQGESRCWSSSVENLQDHGWHLAIQSIEIFDNPSCSADAKLYELANFDGVTVWNGGVGFSNDPNANAYSLNLPSGWSARTWKGDDQQGENRCWSAPVENLQDHSWQLAIQSIEVFHYNSCKPSTPTNFVVSNTTPTSITLTWDDVGEETGYKIFKWGYDEELEVWNFYHYDTLNENVTSYTDFDLACENAFNYYTISAFNSHGESGLANWVQGITDDCLPDPEKVVINEISWSGTKYSMGDEWIELYNHGDSSTDLNGWSLASNTGVIIELSGLIPAHGYYLLENINDDTVSNISADFIYTGDLADEGASLSLRNDTNDIIDTANVDGGPWPAGNAQDSSFSSAFKFSSMERIDPLADDTDSNWATNDTVTRNGLDAGGYPINGTPGEPNSITFPENDALCDSAPTIALNQDHYAILRAADDIDVYQFNVTEPYSTISASLTPPATGDFDLALFGTCDSEVSDPWDIGRRAWHIGRRAWHIGEEQEIVDVRFSVGENTGTYYLVVRQPDDGVYSGAPYQLRVEVNEPDFTIKDTLILFNRTRFKDTYGLEAASDVMASLTYLAEHPKVNGLILDLSQFQTVNDAYAAWDEKDVVDGSVSSYEENVNAAQAVTTAIRNMMRTFLVDENFYIDDYVVIIGGDDQIPFERREIEPPIVLGDSNWKFEEEYFIDLGELANTPLDAALKLNRTLTDDFYGNYAIESGWTAYLPKFAVGRLQDEPGEITQQITQFLDTNGLVKMTSAAIAGYDFLEEPATNLCTTLSTYDWYSRNCLLDPPNPFSGNDLYNAFVTTSPSFVAHYGHSNHTQLFASLDPPLTSTAIGTAPYDLTNNLWWSVGCHSGLDLPDSENYPYSITQALSEQGVTYIGNTGWAWSIDGPPAYSELLYSIIADRLTSGENISIGQALNEAKWIYFQETIKNPYSDAVNYELLHYDEKVVAQATLYGLPMMEFQYPATLSSQSISTTLDVVIEEIIDQALPASFDPTIMAPQNLTQTEETYDGAIYYTGNNGYSVQAGTPILPQAEYFDFETSLGQAKGVLWLGGPYTVETVTKPLISAPVITNPTITAASASLFSGIYPVLPVALLGIEEFDGSFTNRLTFQTGQYFGDQEAGTMRLFSKMTFEIGLWKGESTDDLSPSIGALDILDEGSSLHLEVPITDASGIYRAVVTYNNPIDQSNGSWESIDMLSDSNTCTQGEQTFQVDLPITEDMQYFIQVMDCAGNVSRLLNGEGYFGRVPVNDDFDHALDINSIAPTHDYFTYGATQHTDDPDVSACNLGTGQATVWYKYTHTGPTSAIALDTLGSDYDTFIAVWTGTRTDLSPVACNDDTGGTLQSAIAFQVHDEVTYYIEIGEKTTVMESTAYKDGTK